MKFFVLVLFLFVAIIFKAYGQPTFNEVELKGILFGAGFLIIGTILFIISILSWILLGFKKHYKNLFWTSSFLIVSSVFILSQNNANGPKAFYFPYIIGFVILACLINLLVGNGSIYSGSKQDPPNSEE